MTKGKYAARADTRLRVLESEKLREATAKINDLTVQLKSAKHEKDQLKTDMHSMAQKVAQGLSGREKTHLRNQIASLEYKSIEDRHRYALLVWEIIYRAKFDEPAPLVMSIHDDSQAREYWNSLHWEIACLFFDNWDEIWKFFKAAEGSEWSLAGGVVNGTQSGDFPIKQNAREARRTLTKGPFRNAMMRRVVAMREYYDRVLLGRGSGTVEPVLVFSDIHPEDMHCTDQRDAMLKKMKAGSGD